MQHWLAPSTLMSVVIALQMSFYAFYVNAIWTGLAWALLYVAGLLTALEFTFEQHLSDPAYAVGLTMVCYWGTRLHESMPDASPCCLMLTPQSSADVLAGTAVRSECSLRNCLGVDGP